MRLTVTAIMAMGIGGMVCRGFVWSGHLFPYIDEMPEYPKASADVPPKQVKTNQEQFRWFTTECEKRNVQVLREQLPDTFLNIRLDPVQLVNWSPEKIRDTITRLVADSADPELTGVCCINLDDNVRDEQVAAIFETVEERRKTV